MNKCKWCLCEFNLDEKPKGWMASHVQWCDKNPKDRTQEFEKLEKAREFAKISKQKSGITNQYSKAKSLGLEMPKPSKSFIGCWKGRKHTEETKKKLSDRRKKYLSENPDKHVWKRHNKYKSVPCEKLKHWLITNNIPFEPEYSKHGVPNRFFSIDVAFPDKKIAIEVNGNQHYNNDGTLQEYYLDREKLLQSAGWTVIQLHYSVCHNIDTLKETITRILSGAPGGI